MHAINRGLFFLAVALIALGTTQNRAHATPLNAGDLVISEVMADPDAVFDANGEWFELFNSTDSDIDLGGLILRDAGSDLHVISAPLLIAPGEYLVLGRNGDPDSNGGYQPDYVYADFSLANGGDEIIIMEGDEVIERLDYSGDFVITGTAMELLDVNTYPYYESDFVAATSPYGDGDLGTPGAPIPEPSTALLLALGLVALAWQGRRRG